MTSETAINIKEGSATFWHVYQRDNKSTFNGQTDKQMSSEGGASNRTYLPAMPVRRLAADVQSVDVWSVDVHDSTSAPLNIGTSNIGIVYYNVLKQTICSPSWKKVETISTPAGIWTRVPDHDLNIRKLTL